MDDHETSRIRCHGCHNYGHFVIDCHDCYKCELCGKYYLNGKPCPAKTTFADARTSPAAVISTLALSEGKTEQYQVYDPLDSHKGGRSFGDEKQNSSRMRPTHSPESDASQNPERPMMQRYPYQVQHQQESRQVLVDGHIMHTVTRTITEVRRFGDDLLKKAAYCCICYIFMSKEILESRHESDSKNSMEAARNRDFTGGQEIDDRPWFQMIKKRKSVTGTANQENILDNVDSNRNNNYNKRIETVAPFEYRVRDDKQSSRSNNEGHYDATSVPKQDMTVYQEVAPTRLQGAFRSGLQLLTELET